MGHPVCILLVDHQPERRSALAADLKESYEVLTASSVTEAVEIIKRTANLTVVVTELHVRGGWAKSFHSQAGRYLEQRDGLFLVLAEELPRTVPLKLPLDYCRDRDIPVHLRRDWRTQALPAITAHLARMAG